MTNRHPRCPECGNRKDFYVMQLLITRQECHWLPNEPNPAALHWEANDTDVPDGGDIVYGVYCTDCDTRLKGKSADAIYDMNGPDQLAATAFAQTIGILEQERDTP